MIIHGYLEQDEPNFFEKKNSKKTNVEINTGN